MGNSPCRGCEDRKLLCHGQCQRYQEWKKDLEEKKASQPVFPGWNPRAERLTWQSMRWGKKNRR